MAKMPFSDEKMITNNEFTLALSQRLGITHKQAQAQWKTSLELLSEFLATDGVGGVNLAPFGLMRLRVFPSREGHGGMRGNEAFYRIVLKPGKHVREGVKRKAITTHDISVMTGDEESQLHARTRSARNR